MLRIWILICPSIILLRWLIIKPCLFALEVVQEPSNLPLGGDIRYEDYFRNCQDHTPY
jgi:hypothetical protein